jgi:hypothetical protein
VTHAAKYLEMLDEMIPDDIYLLSIGEIAQGYERDVATKDNLAILVDILRGAKF